MAIFYTTDSRGLEKPKLSDVINMMQELLEKYGDGDFYNSYNLFQKPLENHSSANVIELLILQSEEKPNFNIYDLKLIDERS